MLLSLLACVAPTPDRILVYDRQDDGSHRIAPVRLGAIENPERMETRLGDGVRGGYLTVANLFGDAAAELRGGSPVRVRHVVSDGVFVPQDEQGLIFASFFHHLDGVRREFVDLGYDDVLSELFPVDGVYFGLRSLSDLSSFENAAFVAADNAQGFVLFSDANREVPLGAHEAVVRHEFSHGLVGNAISLFEAENRNDAADIIDPTENRAVNEGVADLLAVLTLDDARALPIDGRDVSVERTVDDIANENDPYELGTVIASYVWGIRQEVVDDPIETLLLTLDALERWDAEAWEEGQTDAIRYAELVVEVVGEGYPEHRTWFCPHFELRFSREAEWCTSSLLAP